MEAKGFALLGMIIAAPLVVAGALFMGVILGPLVGYVVGGIFGWLMPESFASLAIWLGLPVGMTAATLGAGLGFVSAFFRVTVNNQGGK